MSIAISSFGADGGRSGIGQYLISLLREFAAKNALAKVFGFASEQKIFLPDENPSLSFQSVSERFRPLPWNLLWHATVLPWELESHDVLWLPSVTRRLTPLANKPRVGTVHDLGTYRVAGKYDPLRSFLLKFVVTPLLKRLDHILTVSEFSKRDIVELAGIAEDRVTVTPLGVNHERYYYGDSQSAREHLYPYLGFTDPYILYVSRLEHPGKNHVALLDAFDRLKATDALPHKLLLIGEKWNGAESIYSKAASLTYRNDVIFPGFLPHEVLPDVYRAADVFVFPSLFEGFGLPVLEAMASGVPVICSNRASLPEVAGDAAMYFDPDEPEMLLGTLRKLINDRDLHSTYRQLGIEHSSRFRWSDTAERTLRVLQSYS